MANPCGMPIKCDRCGFDGYSDPSQGHTCRVFVLLDQWESNKRDAERYRARRWYAYYLQHGTAHEAEFNRLYDEASDADLGSDQYRARADRGAAS